MTAADRDYYIRRVNEEEGAARTSDCPVARSRHAELARLYRLRLAGAFPGDGDIEPGNSADDDAGPGFVCLPESAAA